jgi:hypothetical protein
VNHAKYCLTSAATQHYRCVVIPPFEGDGNLPAGVHAATWGELEQRFGIDAHRRRLLGGLRAMLAVLASAGCRMAYVDGSFASSKTAPLDFDGAWDMAGVDLQRLQVLEPLLFDFSNRRAAQKAKYFGELFPAELMESNSGKTFLDFFQKDKTTGVDKGIVAIDLRTL